MAHGANTARLSVLELIKQDKLFYDSNDCVDFKDSLENYFYKQINYKFIA